MEKNEDFIKKTPVFEFIFQNAIDMGYFDVYNKFCRLRKNSKLTL